MKSVHRKAGHPPDDAPVTDALEAAVIELAAAHAAGWGAVPPSPAGIQAALAPRPTPAGVSLPGRAGQTLDEILAALPDQLSQRAADPTGFTRLALTTGWPMTVGAAGAELAMRLILGLPTAERRQAEFGLLRRYTRTLRDADLAYPLERVLEDYRLGVAQCAWVALNGASAVLPDAADAVQRVLDAYQDFGPY